MDGRRVKYNQRHMKPCPTKTDDISLADEAYDNVHVNLPEDPRSSGGGQTSPAQSAGPVGVVRYPKRQRRPVDRYGVMLS